jgi:hypothetical protein
MIATMNLEEIRAHLRRTEWRGFSDVIILTSDVSAVKGHSLYAGGKEGDARAAEGLLEDVLNDEHIERLRAPLMQSSPFLLAVHAVESEGMNVIPRVFALKLSSLFGLPVASGIIQINRVSHTGADGYHRLAFPPVFDGRVEPVDYFLVDDFVGQGGTLANLRGFVESNGGRVKGATALTGKSYSAKLALDQRTLQSLRDKHGREFEERWFTAFGYSFERLTESEARYLRRADDAHTVSERLASARRAGN